jgi:hypothetical protein
MKNYHVTVNFKNDFPCEVSNIAADSKEDAKAKALKQARSIGWMKPVKNYEVREVAA